MYTMYIHVLEITCIHVCTVHSFIPVGRQKCLKQNSGYVTN